MKLTLIVFLSEVGQIVAPLVGAWIEIVKKPIVGKILTVAPLVGAWIEIAGKGCCGAVLLVAPLVGAWIEIVLYVCDPLSNLCRSPCGSVD